MHFSGYDRRKHDAGLANCLPVHLGEIPEDYSRFIDPVDILVIKVGPMDVQGFFIFGPANLWHRAVIERPRMVIVETSTGVPHAFGTDNAIHFSEVDDIIDGDGHPPAELPNPPASDIDRAVARHIMAEIDDSICLQVGIGGMPNAVCALLAESHITDLGVHTEMQTDGICDLYQQGRITGRLKTLDHPDLRDELERDAFHHRLIPKGFF